MKILLTAVNAKFIHSSLAIRSLEAFCNSGYVFTREFTINHHMDFIVSELYNENPDVVCFSAYIWNIELIISVSIILKKILPGVIIVAGGPEVGFEYDDLLGKPFDIIVIGEGEKTFSELVNYFVAGGVSLADINGISFCGDRGIVKTSKRTVMNLNDIPFPYSGLTELENKVLYYETSRGCPFRCQYCLSGVESEVRFLPEERVKQDLMFFIDKRVMQVKFVDRTFNCNKEHAISIWCFLINNDNGTTNFHFEISGDLLDNEQLELLKTARKGLFQFEIGVQSTNKNTLNEIQRVTTIDLLLENVRKTKEMQNIHVHLDLIAGLPYENYKSFEKSFNDVFTLFPEQLQLGFLKILKGSGLRSNKDRYGLVYSDKAPYEILYTNDLSYSEVLRLKLIEELVEVYYNGRKCVNALKYIISEGIPPFSLFERFAEYWKKNRLHYNSHNKMKQYTIFFEFLKEWFEDLSAAKQLLKFDILLNDNVKTWPDFIDNINIDLKTQAREFFNNPKKVRKYLPHLVEFTPAQLSRMCRIEAFEFDVLKWIRQDIVILFDYSGSRDLNGFVPFQIINI